MRRIVVQGSFDPLPSYLNMLGIQLNPDKVTRRKGKRKPTTMP